MYLLVSQDDMGRRMVFPMVKVKTTIGRDPSCDIVLEDPEVSRQHLKLYIVDDQVQVKDMGSSNGTFLNNQKIDKITPFNPGDNIIMGPNLFSLENVDATVPEDVEMTCMLTVDQLRELGDKPLRDEESSETDQVEATMISSRKDLMAGIYNKKIGLAKHASVEIIFGSDKGKKYLLPQGQFTLGRGENCNIRLSDEMVSTLHGVLITDKDETIYRDENSKNGSILNNRIVKHSVLGHRDTLMLGKTKIKFLDPKKAANAQAQTQPPRPATTNPEAYGDPADLVHPSSARNVVDFIKYYWYLFAGAGIVSILVILYFILR